MSAQPIAQRRGFLSALVAQVSAYVLEPLEDAVDAEPAELQPYPVVAVVPAAPRSGASSVARMLAAELAVRCDGAAVVAARRAWSRRCAPPSRAAARLATGLAGIGFERRACGRLCLVTTDDPRAAIAAARYLAPVVLDLPADGTAGVAARVASHMLVVAAAAHEPALADAVAGVMGGEAVKVVTRVVDPGAWEGRADVYVPEARMAARAALAGTRPLGPLGVAVGELVDRLGIEAR